jgi:hypothetical protein
MGSCLTNVFGGFHQREKEKSIEYSVVYDSDLFQPLLSHSDFLLHNSVINAQFENEEIVGSLSFSQKDGEGGDYNW